MWLDDPMPTKAFFGLTGSIRELKYIANKVNDDSNDGAVNENLNDDHIDQDDVLVSKVYVSCVGIELPQSMWQKAIKPHEKISVY